MITFAKIRYKNFLSTGNYFTEIHLNKNPNTLIIGVNGSGKSTILDALTFGLFGKPFRKINKPNLLNSINESQCVVEIFFSIGKKQYKVIRGIKPTIFEIYCDDKLINQDAKCTDYQDVLEKNILKLNYKSFCQIVILGSASFTPFMQLKTADRREIIEDLLDIQIFSSMNLLVKQKLSSIKDSSVKLKYEIELTAEKIKLQKQNIEEHKKHNEDLIENKKNEIKQNKNEIIKLTNNINLIQKHITILQQKISDKVSIENKNKKLLQVEAKMESHVKKIKKELDLFLNNDSCPTCKQLIAEEFKNQQITQKENKLLEIEKANSDLLKQIDNLNERLNIISEITKNISDHNSEIVKILSTINSINSYIDKLNKEINDLSTKKNNLEQNNNNLNELKKHLSELLKQQQNLSTEKHYYDYAANLLKDTGIKTKIIKQYLPVMNKLINKYLASMNFFVNFNINENFEETIKSRHRDNFSYENFSEGEKQKIDLALLMTWRQIAKMKNSTNTNLLILDEVFDSSLDTSSVELLMNLLNDLSSDTNIFVISHKTDQMLDKFKSVIRFTKKNNFSTMEMEK